MPTVEIATLVERPELADRVYDVHDEWPEFMGQDPLANALFNRIAHVFPSYCVMATAEDGTIVARARCVPFALGVAGREALPAGGLDRVVAALAETARGNGLDTLVAPVRPTRKHLRPDLSMAEYIRQTRDDGLPDDPWLRVHVRAGGRVVGVAPASMTMVGSLAQWRQWTGLPFDRSGDVVMPDALVPVHCDVIHDHAVYVEPNVWVWQDLRA
jgi:hypothetical protein